MTKVEFLSGRPRSNRIEIDASDRDVRFWLSKSELSEATRLEVARADILLVPTLPETDESTLTFPEGTINFLDYLKSNARPGIVVDICSDDENYAELALHTDLMALAEVVVTILAAPIAANLISEYIKYRLQSRISKANVRIKITIGYTNPNRAVEIQYDGPAEEFAPSVKKALSALPHSSDAPDFETRLESAKKNLDIPSKQLTPASAVRPIKKRTRR